MNTRTILKEAAVLLLAMVMITSTLSVANTTPQIITRDIADEIPGTSSSSTNRDPTIWDNTMGVKWYMTSAQLDDSNLSDVFDSFQADDFKFTQAMQVTDVHWQGGYWNFAPQLPKDFGFNWTIEFYSNNATGNKPLTLLKHYEFTNATITHNMWYTTASIKFNYSVVLPQPFVCAAGTTYWVCFYAHGIFPPQTGVNIHNLTNGGIKGHSAMQKSFYFNGHNNWINGSAGGEAYDINFKLTGVVAPMPALTVTWKKGLFGVSAIINNSGTAPATDVQYTIDVNGKLIFVGKHVADNTTDIAAGKTATIKSSVIGLGKAVALVNVTCFEGVSATASKNITVLLFFVF
jgi:hypothetical protein